MKAIRATVVLDIVIVKNTQLLEPQKRSLTPQVLPDGSASQAAGSFNLFGIQLRIFPNSARPLHNPFSLVPMSFLTHLSARSLNPDTEQSGVPLFKPSGATLRSYSAQEPQTV
jgi:hypothetical protein